ncbi:MAG: primosomal protein N' [Rhodospirillaceae bacterium]|nr:primosomal protein N' [Rhodospirillaceae bacterium]
MTAPSRLVRVAVPVPLSDALDYRWEGPGAPPRRGCRVRVPLGRSERIGVVIDHPRKTSLSPEKLRNVIEATDREPVLGEELLRTLRWCADYYHHPIGEVLNQALPVLLRRGRSPLRTAAGPWELTAEGLSQDAGAVRRRARRQAEALDILRHSGPADAGELRRQGVAAAVLRRMNAKGWVRRRPQGRAGTPLEAARDTPPTLTAEQQRCVDAIVASPPGYRTWLLQGVTGSGKTEVYLRLIERELAAGRQSLLLVPEIGLTPQLIDRLQKRFAQRLAVMHSGLAAGRRLDAWQDVRTGAAKLVVGTRSAVFAPLANPGIVIVDEEHDPSYKQQDGFRYSARDLAVLRAKRLDIPVLLASATPSLESVHNADRGQYHPLSISRRIGAAGQPDMRVIDMNRHAVRQGLSTPLVTAIRRHLDADCQVLLFLNRRGFAPVLLCPTCGTAEDCGRCDARMTIHAASGRLRCHHCGRTHALSWVCAACGSERVAVGAGTQRITGELATLFPDARIARLDRDAATRRGGIDTVLAGVARGETQILVGTQMLTKGHDFPRVTLVGVLNADQGLFGTDYRSTERFAQILLQVAGRAGRRELAGEVFIQSHYPQHPLLRRLAGQDYSDFARLALAERRAAGWPPFSHLILWRAEATRRPPAHAFLEQVAAAARPRAAQVDVLGPAPAPMERRGGRYRAQLLLQSRYRPVLHRLMAELAPLVRTWPAARRVRWSVDVDPIEA